MHAGALALLSMLYAYNHFVCRGCDWKTLMGDNHRVRNLYTPESNFRKSASEYNPAARTKSVSAIRDALRFLGGAQDDREERNQLQQLIAEGKEVRLSKHNPGKAPSALHDFSARCIAQLYCTILSSVYMASGRPCVLTAWCRKFSACLSRRWTTHLRCFGVMGCVLLSRCVCDTVSSVS